jgi:hypothetical protein
LRRKGEEGLDCGRRVALHHDNAFSTCGGEGRPVFGQAIAFQACPGEFNVVWIILYRQKGSYLRPGLSFRGVRKCEIEDRSFVHFAFGSDAPAVADDDSLDVRQSDAGPFELFGLVQPLKHSEELAGILHVETRAIVSHREFEFMRVVLATADFDFRAVAMTGVF